MGDRSVKVMEAVLARDVERAVALLATHFENTTRTVLARLPSIAPLPTRLAGRKRQSAVDRSRT